MCPRVEPSGRDRYHAVLVAGEEERRDLVHHPRDRWLLCPVVARGDLPEMDEHLDDPVLGGLDGGLRSHRSPDQRVEHVEQPAEGCFLGPQAHEELGLGGALDEVMMPAMRQVGSWWATGRCDVAQEHLTTEVARGWLARLTALAPAPTNERPVILACGPRDLHTLGLEGLAALLAHHRIGCRVLGARTPHRTVVTAIRATDGAAVVVVSHLTTQRRAAVDALSAAAATGCQVFYAGNAFLFSGGRNEVPGIYLGENLSTASGLLQQSLKSGTTGGAHP